MSSSLGFALGVILSAVVAFYTGSLLLGAFLLVMTLLSQSFQGHPLLSYWLGLANRPNDLVVRFDKSRYPYKFIFTLYDPLPFTDFYYEYDPAKVAFSSYMVKVKSKKGWYKNMIPTITVPNKGLSGIKEKIYARGVQNYTRPSGASSRIEYIEFTFYLQEIDSAPLKHLFKNVGRHGKFIMNGSYSLNRKSIGGVDWFKYSPAI